MISEISLALPVLPVLHTTTARSHWVPLEMKVLLPLMTYSSPSRTARVRTACRSEPVFGSVMAMAEMISPLAILGSHSSFCSSVAKLFR
ncbi:hypothetical protein D9M73_268810 [compost metagenome]